MFLLLINFLELTSCSRAGFYFCWISKEPLWCDALWAPKPTIDHSFHCGMSVGNLRPPVSLLRKILDWLHVTEKRWHTLNPPTWRNTWSFNQHFFDPDEECPVRLGQLGLIEARVLETQSGTCIFGVGCYFVWIRYRVDTFPLLLASCIDSPSNLPTWHF